MRKGKRIVERTLAADARCSTCGWTAYLLGRKAQDFMAEVSRHVEGNPNHRVTRTEVATTTYQLPPA